MRDRVRLLHGLVYGTKYQLWKRFVDFEEAAHKEAALQRELAAELKARRQGLSQHERVAVVLPAPKPLAP